MALEQNALTLYATVKADLGLTDDTQQAYIERQINAVSQKVEGYCNRKFKKQTYTDEEYEGNNTLYLQIKNYPIISVSKVVIDDEEIELTGIEIDSEKGILYYENMWTSQGHIMGVSDFETLRKNNILITYTAGYVLPKDEVAGQTTPIIITAVPRTLPYDLEQVAIDEVVNKYEHKGTAKDIKSWNLGNASKTYETNLSTVSGLLYNSTACLDGMYRRWII